MTSLVKRLAAPVLALVLVLSAARGASAQYDNGRGRTVLDAALREFGYNPARLRREQVQALDNAMARLFPGPDARRSVLNRSQATAVVYMALVYPRGTARDRWDDDRNGRGRDDYARDRDDNDRDQDDDYGDRDRDPYGRGRDGDGGGRDGNGQGQGGQVCRDMSLRAYEIGNVVDAEGSSLFLTGGEKQRVRSAAAEVQRLAAGRGDRAVADQAGTIISGVGGLLPRKADLRPRVRALKSAVEQACGRYDNGR
jgi:hypothetical protein